MRLLAAALGRRWWDEFLTRETREAVGVGERFADGEATNEERDRCWGNYYALFMTTTEPGRRFKGYHERDRMRRHAIAYLSVSPTAFVRGPQTADIWRSVLEPAAADVPPLLREVFGNPARPVAFAPRWRTGTAVELARGMYEASDFAAMPILADALEDAGCDVPAVLDHCRGPGPHVRGCWVVDAVLGKR